MRFQVGNKVKVIIEQPIDSDISLNEELIIHKIDKFDISFKGKEWVVYPYEIEKVEDEIYL